MSNYNFTLATVQEGMSIIGKNDDFIIRMNPLEPSMKMGVHHAVTIDKYISFVKENVLPWNQDETVRLNEIIRSVEKLLSIFNITFENEICLIKTTGKEEWNSAYTRSNAIILPSKKLECYDEHKLLSLILHEFCHAFLRQRNDLQKLLYGAIGFEIIDEVILPDSLLPRKLTNPDAPFLNCSIEITCKNENINVVPITILKEEYRNINPDEDIFESVTMKLLAVEMVNGKWVAKEYNQGFLLMDVSDVTGFFEKVGMNTDYIIHPEEIIAENFVLLLLKNTNVPSPQIISKFKDIFNCDFK